MNDLISPVDIRPDHLKIVRDILREHLPTGVKIWVFGSRANWTTKDSSDLDLAVEGATRLDQIAMSALEMAFEESDLPYDVDVVDLNTVGHVFKQIVEEQRVPLPLNGVGADGAGVGGWSSTVWGELATLEYGKPLRGYRSSTGSYRVYGTNGQIGWHSEPLCPYGSVIIGRKGAYRGVHYSPDPFFVIDTAFYLKPRVELDARWAYYQLLTQNINEMDSGSAIPSTSREDFYGLPVEVPPINEQRAIAHVLGTLDDKIELNRRMNETLEEMARVLFKSWFVDFEPVRAKMEGRWRRGDSLPGLPAELYELFPDRLASSELGQIPEGWEVRRIEDISSRVAMGPFGSSIKVSTFVDSGIPIISGQHLKGTLLEDSGYRFITEEHAKRLAKSNVQRGDIIFTHAGNIGQVAYIPNTSLYKRYVISQRQFYMRCDTSKISPLFVLHFFKTTAGQHQLLANTSSTGVPSIARPVTNLRSIHLCVPPHSLWKRFDTIVNTLFENIGQKVKESEVLASKRSTLLPRLVSGVERVVDLS